MSSYQKRISEGNLFVIERLLQSDSEISWFLNKKPALHCFVELEDPKLLQSVIKRWEKDFDCVDEKGNSALHLAAIGAVDADQEADNLHKVKNSWLQMIKLLVNAGSSYTLPNHDIKTPYAMISQLSIPNDPAALDLITLFGKPERLKAISRNRVLSQITTRSAISSLPIPESTERYLSGKL